MTYSGQTHCHSSRIETTKAAILPEYEITADTFVSIKLIRTVFQDKLGANVPVHVPGRTVKDGSSPRREKLLWIASFHTGRQQRSPGAEAKFHHLMLSAGDSAPCTASALLLFLLSLTFYWNTGGFCITTNVLLVQSLVKTKGCRKWHLGSVQTAGLVAQFQLYFLALHHRCSNPIRHKCERSVALKWHAK